jgi:hypothetical protein
MDDDVVSQLLMEAERLRQEINFQQDDFQRKIAKQEQYYQQELVKQDRYYQQEIAKNEEHFLQEYKALQEHNDKQFAEEEERFSTEQKLYLKENEELRQKLNSGDNWNYREKYIIENEITDVLDRRIKILEKELETAYSELQKKND